MKKHSDPSFDFWDALTHGIKQVVLGISKQELADYQADLDTCALSPREPSQCIGKEHLYNQLRKAVEAGKFDELIAYGGQIADSNGTSSSFNTAMNYSLRSIFGSRELIPQEEVLEALEAIRKSKTPKQVNDVRLKHLADRLAAKKGLGDSMAAQIMALQLADHIMPHNVNAKINEWRSQIEADFPKLRSQAIERGFPEAAAEANLSRDDFEKSYNIWSDLRNLAFLQNVEEVPAGQAFNEQDLMRDWDRKHPEPRYPSSDSAPFGEFKADDQIMQYQLELKAAEFLLEPKRLAFLDSSSREYARLLIDKEQKISAGELSGDDMRSHFERISKPPSDALVVQAMQNTSDLVEAISPSVIILNALVESLIKHTPRGTHATSPLDFPHSLRDLYLVPLGITDSSKQHEVLERLRNEFAIPVVNSGNQDRLPISRLDAFTQRLDLSVDDSDHQKHFWPTIRMIRDLVTSDPRNEVADQ